MARKNSFESLIHSLLHTSFRCMNEENQMGEYFLHISFPEHICHLVLGSWLPWRQQDVNTRSEQGYIISTGQFRGQAKSQAGYQKPIWVADFCFPHFSLPFPSLPTDHLLPTPSFVSRVGEEGTKRKNRGLGFSEMLPKCFSWRGHMKTASAWMGKVT